MKMLLSLSVFIILSSNAVFAHPPADIEAEYDAKEHILSARIYHNVYDAKTHYVKKVVISRNGKELLSDNLSGQENDQSQSVKYVILDVNPGDEITVEALCNVYGKLSKEITI